MKRYFVIGIWMLAAAVISLPGCSGSKKVKTPTTAEQPEEETTKKSPITKNEEEKPATTKEVVQLSLRDINFDFDRYDLRSEALSLLGEHARQLKERPEVKIVIEGHCDEWGSAEYNLALGERRAAAVKSYLVKSGITSERISTISYGKERPLDPRNSADAWAKNRRAAFVLKEKS